jgi:3-oxoacyl-[acyl-carrier-protein] synthase-3
MGTIILGTGSWLPRRVMSNVELEEMVDTTDEWIRTRTGIENRRIAGAGENTYQLAARAARKALAMAQLSAEEIELIVVGTISSHMLMPSCACYVQHEIGAVNAHAYDINAACSGFLYGIDIADHHVQARKEAKVLIIGAEAMSSRLNWQDRNTCILFGDGAGAAVFGHSEDARRGVLGSSHGTDGGQWELLYMHTAPSTNAEIEVAGNKGAFLVMEGKEIFKFAVKAMEEAVCRVLDDTGLSLGDISLLIPHQANMRILSKLLERLAVPREKVFLNVMNYGNTSAASIPIALDEANRAGRLKAGDTILFCSFGGGLTWGATLIRW